MILFVCVFFLWFACHFGECRCLCMRVLRDREREFYMLLNFVYLCSCRFLSIFLIVSFFCCCCQFVVRSGILKIERMRHRNKTMDQNSIHKRLFRSCTYNCDASTIVLRHLFMHKNPQRTAQINSILCRSIHTHRR